MGVSWLALLHSSLLGSVVNLTPVAGPTPGHTVPLPLIGVDNHASGMYSTEEPGEAKSAPGHPATQPGENKAFAYVVRVVPPKPPAKLSAKSPETCMPAEAQLEPTGKRLPLAKVEAVPEAPPAVAPEAPKPLDVPPLPVTR